MRVSSRGNVSPFIVMDVMERARQLEEAGRRIIHMEVGQPSTAAPQRALSAVGDAMARSAPLGYTVACGLPVLREKIAALYKMWYGVALDPARVIVTPGASGAFSLAFSALFDNGDRLGLGAPGYPSYRQIAKACGLLPVDISTHASHGFQPQVGDIADLPIEGLLVASPANPTGTMLCKEEMQHLLSHCADRKIAFISDEIYHGLEYDKKSVTALQISDECYVINSFSKYFSMTGWRVGWMVVPPAHIRRVERIAQNMFICAAHVSQLAALHAMEDHDELRRNVAVYAQNRAFLLNALPELGFEEFSAPDGAFYFYINVSQITPDSLAFCEDVLETVGVALTPGKDFDPLRGHQYIRLSYARCHEDIVEGIKRLHDYLGRD